MSDACYVSDMNKRISVRVTEAQVDALCKAMGADRAANRHNVNHSDVTRAGWKQYCEAHGVPWPADTQEPT